MSPAARDMADFRAASRVILVCGLGRCGSSLTMQMLDAAGVPCLGDRPAFEGPEVEAFQFGAIGPARWEQVRGSAVKLLDPHRHTVAWPIGEDVRAVWLSRDLEEQAKSQAKLAYQLGDGLRPNRKVHRAWASRLEGEAYVAREGLICALGRGRVMDLRYEDLLQAPRVSALRLAQYGGFGFDMDVIEQMAACVRKTDPACSPDLHMEASLIQAYGERSVH